MVLNFQIGVIVGLALGLSLLIASIVFYLHHTLHKKVKKELEEKKEIFEKRIRELKELEKSPQTFDPGNISSFKILKRFFTQKQRNKIDIIDYIAREFFLDSYDIEGEDYSELAKIFHKMERPDIQGFCLRMSEALYAGRDMGQSQLNELRDQLEAIIRREEKEIMEEIEKESEKVLIKKKEKKI